MTSVGGDPSATQCKPPLQHTCTHTETVLYTTCVHILKHTRPLQHTCTHTENAFVLCTTLIHVLKMHSSTLTVSVDVIVFISFVVQTIFTTHQCTRTYNALVHTVSGDVIISIRYVVYAVSRRQNSARCRIRGVYHVRCRHICTRFFSFFPFLPFSFLFLITAGTYIRALFLGWTALVCEHCCLYEVCDTACCHRRCYLLLLLLLLLMLLPLLRLPTT